MEGTRHKGEPSAALLYAIQALAMAAKLDGIHMVGISFHATAPLEQGDAKRHGHTPPGHIYRVSPGALSDAGLLVEWHIYGGYEPGELPAVEVA